MRGRASRALLLALMGSTAAAATAQTSPAGSATPATPSGSAAQTIPTDPVRSELEAARREIQQQREMLRRQEERLEALERRLATGVPAAGAAAAPATVPAQASAPTGAPPAGPSRPDGAPMPAVAAAQGSAPGSGEPGSVQQAPIETVGAAPDDFDRAPEVAVLGEQGSVVTREGQLTGEVGFEYARADRSRAVFRGVEIIESILIGAFDINESRQDVLTANVSARYGLTNRLEIGARLPFVYRNDQSVLVPIATQDSNDPASVDNSARGYGFGDVEFSGRYQLRGARGGWPFLIANLQAVIPTGESPFEVPRDSLGRQTRAATGAGFYGISPSLTAILPSDPVVLFGTLGYTFNLAKDVNTSIGPLTVNRVDPGDAISASAGIGIAFNQRTTLNLGYAHTWAFGSRTWTELVAPDGAVSQAQTTSRDLQVGRLLFGVTYRVTDRASLNWSVELGATEDAPDMRTVLRIPIVLLTGG